MAKILFVCTGNVFRSMIAEKCLKEYVKRNKIENFYVDSAGIETTTQKPNHFTVQRLKFYGINTKNHKYKQLTKKLIENNNLIIAMNTNHRSFIQKTFGIKVPLFNEVAYKKHDGILDFHEHDPQIKDLSNRTKDKEIRKYAYCIVDYIYKSTPNLFKNINKWV